MPVIKTVYTAKSVLLIFALGLLCLFTTFIVVMTFGFAIDQPHGFRNWSGTLALLTSLLTVPAFLIGLRWSGIAHRVMWGITILCCVFLLASWHVARYSGLLVLLTIQSLIWTTLASKK